MNAPKGILMSNSKSPLIVAYGGGANSTAMLIEMRRRDIVPDLILFADTGRGDVQGRESERPETYSGIRLVSEWCMANGFPAIITVRYVSEMRGEETLEENCLRIKSLPSIAYGYKSCSEKFKIRPQNRYVAQLDWAKSIWDAGGRITKYIGYDAGEDHRAKIRYTDEYELVYPLIEWGFHRDDCVRICREEDLNVGKSACFFCPSMKRREIIQLAKEHPDLAARAIAMEENAELTTIKGLGRSFSWKDFLANEADQSRLFSDHEVPEIPCGCYDGGADE